MRQGRCTAPITPNFPAVTSKRYPIVRDAFFRVNLACDASQVDESTPLLDQGLLDSLQIVTLIGELESGLGCQIPLDEVIPDNFRDLSSICALVERSMPGSNPG